MASFWLPPDLVTSGLGYLSAPRNRPCMQMPKVGAQDGRLGYKLYVRYTTLQAVFLVSCLCWRGKSLLPERLGKPPVLLARRLTVMTAVVGVKASVPVCCVGRVGGRPSHLTVTVLRNAAKVLGVFPYYYSTRDTPFPCQSVNPPHPSPQSCSVGSV